MRTRTRIDTYSKNSNTNIKIDNYTDSAQNKRIVSLGVFIFIGLMFYVTLNTSNIERGGAILAGLFIYILFPIALLTIWVLKPMLVKKIINKLDTFIHVIYLFIFYNVLFGYILQLGLVSGIIISFFLCLLFFHSRNNIYYKEYSIKNLGVGTIKNIKNYNNNLNYYRNNQHKKIIQRKIFERHFSKLRKKLLLSIYLVYIAGYLYLSYVMNNLEALTRPSITVLLSWSFIVALIYYRFYYENYSKVYSQKNNFMFLSMPSTDLLYNQEKNPEGGINYIFSNDKQGLK